MKIGAQFYTVHNFCKTIEGLEEALKKVAEIGYTTVQLSGVCAYDPTWMAEQLKKNGLTCGLTHTNAARLFAETDKVIDEHFEYGCKYIGLGGLPGAPESQGIYDNYKYFRDEWKPVVNKINARGAKLMIHNHSGEFQTFDGMQIMDHICSAYAPEKVGLTFDTYWAQNAGIDCVRWIGEHRGRLNCVHFKDMAFNHEMAPVGWGNMNFEGIVKACLDNDVEYAFVEQDDCHDEDPFVCLKKSYDYLKSLGLE